MKFLSAASFWLPEYYLVSSWEGHAPFAFWLMDALRPKRFVELGTFQGFSYFAFCQAIAWLGLDTQATAVDNWRGTEADGTYDDTVYEGVVAYNAKYPFSQLVRREFVDALPLFEDGSIDLLHFDGNHRYSAVKADFENYRDKLSPDAIMLFHDTRLGGYSGVWRLFLELGYPKFEFFHASGLGMAAVGKIKDELRPWFDSRRPHLDWIRNIYAELGHTMVSRSLLSPEDRATEAQRMVDLTNRALQDADHA